MIIGTHAIVYAEDADLAREFLRDVLGLWSVDAGDGWLIFRLPPAEVGVHPAGAPEAGRHELYLMCDDIAATVEELAAKGAEFVGDISDRGFGLMATLRVPGAGTLGLYEPRHPVAHDF
jgi:predicted enzyme related to lactoylglutathione lyase